MALFARSGVIAKAMVEAIKASTVGNQTRLFDHSQKIATNPPFSPKAFRTQAYSPPPSGHPVASSAPAREIGIRNRMVPMMYQPMLDQPYTAIEGKFLIDSTAATLIMARAKTPRTFTRLSER